MRCPHCNSARVEPRLFGYRTRTRETAAHLHDQCLNCGAKIGQAQPQDAFKTYEGADEALFERWKGVRNADGPDQPELF